jgi:drug/metabolite transporter (DMT)-like permease
MAPIAFILLFPFALYSEISQILEWEHYGTSTGFGVLLLSGTIAYLLSYNKKDFFFFSFFLKKFFFLNKANLLIYIYIYIGVLLDLSTFFAIENTSPLTYTVAGNLKVVLSILISVLIFQNPVCHPFY